MKEVEILVKVLCDDTKKIKEKIENVAQYKNTSYTVDTYFYDPLRSALKPDETLAIYECFRVRQKGLDNYLTYKIDRFDDDGKWLYSDEHETKVQDYKIAHDIVKCLGLKELVIVDMTKEGYENNDYNIVVEYVKNLGVFLEVESKKQFETKDEIRAEKKNIEKFINSLGFEVSEDVGIGKPEQLIKKLNIRV